MTNNGIIDIIKTSRGEDIEVTLEKKMTLSTFVEGYKRCYLQGGGTDGRYGYYIINEGGNTGAEKSKLYKIDLETWEIVAEAQDFLWCHANDVTYDTRRGLVIVSHCNKDISLVDPDTLEVVEVKRLTTGGQYSIAYNPKRDRYAIGKSMCYDIGILNSDFELIETFEGEDGYIKQGMECDDEFIYFFHTGKKNNWVWVYDWDGNYQKKFKVPMVGESENLFVRGNKFIAAFNNHKDRTGDIYEMTLTVKSPSETSSDDIKPPLTATLSKKLSLPLACENQPLRSLVGGGFDGRFVYYALRERGGERGRILKVDTDSWSVADSSAELVMGHVNDVDYDTERNMLAFTDGSKDIVFVSPDTFEIKGRETLDIGVIQYGIAYSPERKLYAVGNRGYDFDVFTHKLERVVRNRGRDGHDRNGMACDGRYVYFLQSGVRNNWIWIYDWEGSLINTVKIPMAGKAVGAFVKDGKLFVTFNDYAANVANICEVTLSEQI